MPAWQLDGFDELRELGIGGGGRVVLARHGETGTLVAIKYLAAWLVESRERLAAFRSEAQLMAGLVDANLVTMYEYVETDAGAAIVMELIDGVALRAMLENRGPLSPQAALTLLKGSLLGLAVLHRQGVVHRDYKPENVMVDAAGSTKLVDYGIAAPVGESAGIAGTPLYMAPEQWVGGPSTAASDVYAASATFVECLTGRTIFDATTVDALRYKHLTSAPTLEGLPDSIRGIAEAGLAKDPALRISDAAVLVERLEAAAGQTYGEDWEATGRQQLARRAALLALLFPRSRMKVSDRALARTDLGQGDGWGGAAATRRSLWERPAGRSARGGGRPWGAATLAVAAALIVAAGGAIGAFARAADESAANSAPPGLHQLPPIALVAAPTATPTLPSASPTPTPTPAAASPTPMIVPTTPPPAPAPAVTSAPPIAPPVPSPVPSPTPNPTPGLTRSPGPAAVTPSGPSPSPSPSPDKGPSTPPTKGG